MSVMEKSAWMTRAGECRDKNGYPIYPGDLIKTFHFVARNGKTHYLYHVVCETPDGYLEAVPAQYLNPTTKQEGGRFPIQKTECYFEIIDGSGPGRGVCFTDRSRIKPGKEAKPC